MNLPLSPPVLPMLAKRIADIPVGANWTFEPKWDGFRAIVFRDGLELLIQSRDGKPLNRYFPELVETLLHQLPGKCILDGEIVIAANGRLDFDALQLRVHPAASRIQKLAQATPASIVFFDLLSVGKRVLTTEPLSIRAQLLGDLLAGVTAPLHQTPYTSDQATAQDWFKRFEGAGLDGVMAKDRKGIYEPNKRSMFKVKHERDCDCVVAGFRWHKDGTGSAIGSLLLGLYDSAAELHHVGVCASFTMQERKELVTFLEAYRQNASMSHPWGQTDERGLQRMPGSPSRWNSGKDLSWEAVRPELVLEVAYEHMQGDRFRHMAQFRRWRWDKRPADCTYAQLEVVPPAELSQIFSLDR
jgi:ATP-dependent DNA ligase